MMLTIYLRQYTEREKLALIQALVAAQEFVDMHYCCRDCNVCPYRHLCRDLENAKKFAKKQANF